MYNRNQVWSLSITSVRKSVSSATSASFVLSTRLFCPRICRIFFGCRQHGARGVVAGDTPNLVASADRGLFKIKITCSSSSFWSMMTSQATTTTTKSKSPLSCTLLSICRCNCNDVRTNTHKHSHIDTCTLFLFSFFLFLLFVGCSKQCPELIHGGPSG